MTIQEAVQGKIASCGPVVFDAVVERMADVEIKRRQEIIVAAISTQEKWTKDLKKTDRPDQVTYDSGGKKEVYSEARWNQVAKAKENLSKLESLLASSLNDNKEDDYDKLKKMCSGKPEGASESPSEPKA